MNVGTFIAEELVTAERRVAKTNNVGGYPAIFPRTARAVLEQYPALTDAERESVFATLTERAREIEKRKKIGVTIALGGVSRILGIPRIRAARAGK